MGRQPLAAVAGALPEERVPPGELLAGLWRVGRSGDGKRGLRLYLEVAGLAAAGREELVAAAADVGHRWLSWAQDHLNVPEAARWWLEELGSG